MAGKNEKKQLQKRRAGGEKPKLLFQSQKFELKWCQLPKRKREEKKEEKEMEKMQF